MNLLGRAESSEFWNEVRVKECFRPYREELLLMWEDYGTKPIEAFKYSEFRMFFDSGDRAVFEKQYFTRRKSLTASALLSLIYPDEEKYVIRLMDTIFAICDEYTWCLPAHQTALEKNNNSHVDLFACETSFALAEIDTMLSDRLEPLIRDRIRVEINRRLIQPFDEIVFEWENKTNNWNAVCTGSVASVVMLLYPELFEKFKERFLINIERFLSGFLDDGICSEGVNYWHYGFGFFTVYADMLRKFTSGEINYFDRPKVREISAFLQKIYLSDGSTVSFSDGGLNAKYRIGLAHYLKNEYPEYVILPPVRNSYRINGTNFCLDLRSAIWLREDYLSERELDSDYEYFAESSEWMIHKTSGYGFAAKGGHNAEPHNHNDVGSFIFAKSGKQIFVDLGAGKYTRQYFRLETRYDIIQCSSRGHSLPIIDGTYQSFGREFAAKSVSVSDGVFSLDISGAYNVEKLKSLVRSFRFSEDALCLTDEYTLSSDAEIVERFVTLDKPEVIRDGEILIDGVKFSFDPSVCNIFVSSEPTRDDNVAYLIDLKLKRGVARFECKISL